MGDMRTKLKLLEHSTTLKSSNTLQTKIAYMNDGGTEVVRTE